MAKARREPWLRRAPALFAGKEVGRVSLLTFFTRLKKVRRMPGAPGGVEVAEPGTCKTLPAHKNRLQ